MGHGDQVAYLLTLQPRPPGQFPLLWIPLKVDSLSGHSVNEWVARHPDMMYAPSKIQENHQVPNSTTLRHHQLKGAPLFIFHCEEFYKTLSVKP